MTYAFDEDSYTLRFERGEEVVSLLDNFIKEHDIKGGWIMGLGGLSLAELGFYDNVAQEYEWARFETPLELANITGNIAWQNNAPAIHLHATISDASLHASAGHLREAVVSGTVEITIQPWKLKQGLARTKDKSSGLNLLDL